MAVTRADKTAELESLEGAFRGHDVAILIDYKGINVPQVTQLRTELRKAKAAVVRAWVVARQAVLAERIGAWCAALEADDPLRARFARAAKCVDAIFCLN